VPFFLVLGLGACSNLSPVSGPEPVPGYQQDLLQLEQWSLRGRLNIRDTDRADTINISWDQSGSTYDINLSGTLGLGAVHIKGSDAGVLVEKGREPPLMADSLEALGNELLGYAFPARELLYWIRALPAPDNRPEISLNPQGLTATLSQADASGRHWEMQYDRYTTVEGYILPGRIRLEQAPYRLTFLISDWQNLTQEAP